MSVTRDGPPPKPFGFHWRENTRDRAYELRMSENRRGSGGDRKQPYIGGMAITKWVEMYDSCSSDQERIEAIADWLRGKLTKKGITPHS